MSDQKEPARWREAVVEVLVNFVLPFLIFMLGRGPLGELHALIISSAAPLLWSILEFVRKRRIDALSLIALTGISFSTVAMIASGSVKLLQLREQFVIGLIGLIFLGSALINRPLIYYLARARIRRRSQSEAADFEARRGEGAVRRTMMILTVTWGLAFLIDAALCAALVFVLPIAVFLVVSPIIGYGAIGVLTAWTYWFARRQLRAAQRTPGA